MSKGLNVLSLFDGMACGMIAFKKLGINIDTPDFKLLKNIECDECQHYKDCSRFVELPVGEWIYGEDYFGYPVYRCSNCKEQLDFEEGTPKSNDYRFCPFCGAKMEDVEQELKERNEANH